MEILQKDIRLKYREDECLKEEDFIRIVDVISDIDGLLARLSPPPLGKRRFEDVDVAPKATTSKSVKDLSAEQMLSVLSKTSLIQWRRIADDLPEYLHRMRYRVTPKVCRRSVMSAQAHPTLHDAVLNCRTSLSASTLI